MQVVNTIKELLSYPPTMDEVVYVSGYHYPKDGGGAHFYWDSVSQLTDNGGTVIRSQSTVVGRWLQQHKGVGDLRTFGFINANVPADDALDALVNDPSISTIQIHTDILFQRRHRFNRSNITLDFQNNTVFTSGIEPAPDDDPFAAVTFFQGDVIGLPIVMTTKEIIRDQTDIYPVDNSSLFSVGDWYTVVVNPLKGKYQCELQKMVQVIAIIDATHIQISYANGWELDINRQITWTKVKPVSNITIKNMIFIGAGDNQIMGSHPVAFEYAINANVFGIHSTGSFWPVVMRRWNTHYLTTQCSLLNPPNTAYGGAGYLTQQIYCLYGHISDCHVSNARHLNDFTASAYCMVDNCHAVGQSAEKGPFVTHGQYEHDLTYTGNSGLMTFANSGSDWGGYAKRISVRKHVCPWFVARYNIIDLTLDDVVIISDAAISGSGMLWVNADGLRMTGCSADGIFRISQSSQKSNRKNIIENCYFTFSDDTSEIIQANVTSPIIFIDTMFDKINGHHFLSSSQVSFVRSTFRGGNVADYPKMFSHRFSFQQCLLTNSGFITEGTGDKNIDISLTTINGGSMSFLNFNGKAKSTLFFVNNVVEYTNIIMPEYMDNVIWQQNIVLD